MAILPLSLGTTARNYRLGLESADKTSKGILAFSGFFRTFNYEIQSLTQHSGLCLSVVRFVDLLNPLVSLTLMATGDLKAKTWALLTVHVTKAIEVLDKMGVLQIGSISRCVRQIPFLGNPLYKLNFEQVLNPLVILLSSMSLYDLYKKGSYSTAIIAHNQEITELENKLKGQISELEKMRFEKELESKRKLATRDAINQKRMYLAVAADVGKVACCALPLLVSKQPKLMATLGLATAAAQLCKVAYLLHSHNNYIRSEA